MFIGREYELKQLNRYYQMNSFQFPVIYGRRRVGKTALLNEFTKDKDVIFFTAIESNGMQNLENLSKCIFDYEKMNGVYPLFDSFQMAIEYIFKLSLTKQFVFVIDEYPYLAKVCPEISSILQVCIDEYKDESNLFLLLCGSSMSFMEEQVLGYQSPLYGRRTAQFKIQPFDFFESCKFYNKFTIYEMAQLYGITGGTPQYLLKMQGCLSFEENIKENVLNPSCYLFEEPNNLLKQEIREAGFYNLIISTIASGYTRLNEIASKVQEDTGRVTLALNKLIKLGLIKKESPIGNDSTRKTIYSIQENLFNFYYRFIFRNISLLQNNMIDISYIKIMEQYNEYMGFIFEEICKQYLWHLNKICKLPFIFTELGKWWGNDPFQKEEAEIDIMATDGRQLLIAECKWTSEKVSKNVLVKLLNRKRIFKHEQIHMYVFSKSGFDDSCYECAKEQNISLISFEEMMS